MKHSPRLLTQAAPALVSVLLLGGALPARAQEPGDSLRAAREAYAAAAYDDSLAALARVPVADSDTTLRVEIEKYRGLCLLALGQRPEAERAFGTMITLDPRHRLAASDAAPWVTDVFDAVRRRAVPIVAEQDYRAAKAALDRGEYEEAIGRFTETLALLDDAGSLVAADPRVADVRASARSYLNLIQHAPSAAATRSRSEASKTTPPIAVRQYIPPLPAELVPFAPFINCQAALEIEVDETGRVTDAVLQSSLRSRYDALLLQAARTWLFLPATRDGAPVRVRQLIKVSVPLT